MVLLTLDPMKESDRYLKLPWKVYSSLMILWFYASFYHWNTQKIATVAAPINDNLTVPDLSIPAKIRWFLSVSERHMADLLHMAADE